MENLIYSASPLRAFSGGFITIAFMLGIAVMGAFLAIARRKDSKFARIAMGCSSVILLFAGLGVSISLLRTVQSEAKTVVVLVNDKQVVTSNCGDNGGTCTNYLLEAQAGQKAYDFSVAKTAFDRAEIGACYQFTYYPAQSLLGKYLQEEDFSDSYESASTITRIEQVNCQ